MMNSIFLTSDMMSCKYSIWKSIDHIIVSKPIKNKVVASTLAMIDINTMFDENEAKKVSDHCPIIVKIDFNK